MHAAVALEIASVLLGASPAASGPGPGSTRWDFRSDAVNAPPAGFSFGRTGQGREGKWVVVEDPTAPGSDHVLAQLDQDSTGYRFPLAVADGPLLANARIEVRADHLRVFWEGEPVVDVRDATFGEAGKVGVWTKADSVTHFAALTATRLD